jgi:hypothetical protein
MLPSSLDHFHVKYAQNDIHAYERGTSKAKHEMHRNYAGDKQTWVLSANDETIIYKSMNLSKLSLSFIGSSLFTRAQLQSSGPSNYQEYSIPTYKRYTTPHILQWVWTVGE